MRSNVKPFPQPDSIRVIDGARGAASVAIALIRADHWAGAQIVQELAAALEAACEQKTYKGQFIDTRRNGPKEWER